MATKATEWLHKYLDGGHCKDCHKRLWSSFDAWAGYCYPCARKASSNQPSADETCPDCGRELNADDECPWVAANREEIADHGPTPNQPSSAMDELDAANDAIRDLAETNHNLGIQLEDAKRIITAQEQEIIRLKRGEFTSDEIQNFCHNLPETVSVQEFCNGCKQYQQQLYGESPIEAQEQRIAELERKLKVSDVEIEIKHEDQTWQMQRIAELEARIKELRNWKRN